MRFLHVSYLLFNLFPTADDLYPHQAPAPPHLTCASVTLHKQRIHGRANLQKVEQVNFHIRSRRRSKLADASRPHLQHHPASTPATYFQCQKMRRRSKQGKFSTLDAWQWCHSPNQAKL